MRPPQVFLIDDDEEVLSAFSFIVKRKGYEPICINDPALALTKSLPIDNGCIVLDLNMPRINGLDLLKAFRKQRVTLPVIIATGSVDVSLAVECMELGAFSLLEKPIEKASFLNKIDSAIEHINSLSRSLAKRHDALLKLDTLSRREMQVAVMVSEGLRTREIATQLHISSRTVETHRENLLRKLDLASTSQISGILVYREQ